MSDIISFTYYARILDVVEFMLSVYNYSDYRVFLKDWFWAAKSAKKNFSFRNLSRQLGLTSPNHFHLVISETRHLSAQLFEKLLRLLGLSKREERFLRLIFISNTTADNEKIGDLNRQINLLRQASLRESLNPQNFSILGNTLAWYIKMGAIFFEGKTRTEILSLVKSSCVVKVEDEQIENAILTLEKMELLSFEHDRANFDFGNITTKWDFDRFEIKNHHLSNLRLAEEAVSWPIDRRFLSSVTIPCGPEFYEKMIQEIRTLCLKLLSESNHHGTLLGKEFNKVITLQFALFPYFEFPDASRVKLAKSSLNIASQ